MQLESLRQQVSSFTDGVVPSADVQAARVAPISGPNGARCTIDTGAVYKRTSGTGYQYGTVGGKPRTTCTVLMVRIEQSTTLYKTVWWGLQSVAGPFNAVNYGQGTLQQTNVQRVCNDLRSTTFRMIVRGTGVFPTGTSGTASAYEEATLSCGTNP